MKVKKKRGGHTFIFSFKQVLLHNPCFSGNGALSSTYKVRFLRHYEPGPGVGGHFCSVIQTPQVYYCTSTVKKHALSAVFSSSFFNFDDCWVRAWCSSPP